jgi:hypothetical protein
MLVFRKAAAGELQEDSGLGMLAKEWEINVEEVGVGGAKDFFEAKVQKIQWGHYEAAVACCAPMNFRAIFKF